jgi:hypothetical protein
MVLCRRSGRLQTDLACSRRMGRRSALLHLARRCGWRVAKWSRFPSRRLPEVLKAINPTIVDGVPGALVEDAGLSDHQMQQCSWVYGGLRVADGQAVTCTAASRNSVNYQRFLELVEVARHCCIGGDCVPAARLSA